MLQLSSLGHFIKATRFWQDNYLILRELRHFRGIATVAISCTLLAAVFEGATVGVIVTFLQGLTNPDEPPIQTGIRWFDVWFLATQASPTARIYRLSALILVAVWLRSILNYLGQFYSRLSELNLTERIRRKIFEQLQSLSLSYYSKSRSGKLINTMTTEVEQLKQAFGIVSFLMIRGSTLLAYVVSMFWLSWSLSIAAVLLFTLLSLGLSSLIARVREASFAVPRANAQVTSIAIEFINGIRTIQASATQDFERRRFERAIAGVLAVNTKVFAISSAVKPLAESFAITILITMIIVAYHFFIVRGALEAASLLGFMFVLFRMMPLVSQVNQAREQIGRFHGSVNDIKELLQKDYKTYLNNGKTPFLGLQQGIDFVSVDFGYDADELVLRDVSLSIREGQTTAIVGASGAGKTTLVDLIPRFYDPTGGRVLIDGDDLRKLDINSLRRRMGIVSQDTFIFNASIRENIAYGVEADAKAVQEAAWSANVGEFIEELPEGMETQLGDRGVRLSGGQRQRIAIARALLRNPEILILDEATSALDSETERMIQESLERLFQGRTVIAIAHRLSTIVRADKVVVLERGQLVEQGTYQELLAQRGQLWKYHQMQYEH